MSNDTYKYQKILLGLSQESKKTNKKLKELKESTKIVDKSIEEYEYWIHRWMYEIEPALLCEVIARNPIHRNNKNNRNSILVKENEHYSFNQPIGLYIEKDKQTTFDEEINEIMSSDYVKNAYTNYIQGRNGNYFHATQITPSIIRSSIFKGLDGNLTYQYNLIKNKMNLLHFPYKITEEIIADILDLEYPKEAFPDYLQKAIEKGEEKEFVISDLGRPSTDLQLQFEENDKKVLIKRIN